MLSGKTIGGYIKTEAIEYIIRTVLEPAEKSKDRVQSERAKTSRKFIEAARKTGDVYLYMLNSISHQNLKVDLESGDFASFESISPDFEEKFRNSLSHYSTTDELQIGKEYSFYETAMYTNNYSSQ